MRIHSAFKSQAPCYICKTVIISSYGVDEVIVKIIIILVQKSCYTADNKNIININNLPITCHPKLIVNLRFSICIFEIKL